MGRCGLTALIPIRIGPRLSWPTGRFLKAFLCAIAAMSQIVFDQATYSLGRCTTTSWIALSKAEVTGHAGSGVRKLNSPRTKLKKFDEGVSASHPVASLSNSGLPKDTSSRLLLGNGGVMSPRVDLPGSEIYLPYVRRLSADERESGRQIPEGHDLCHTCFQSFEESDLWHAGGDGHPTCTRCVMNQDLYYYKLRIELRMAAAILELPHQTKTAQSLAAQIRNLLDG